MHAWLSVIIIVRVMPQPCGHRPRTSLRGGKMKRLLPILSVITWAIASHPRNPVDSGSKLSPCLRAPPPVNVMTVCPLAIM
jgi:hypothetical protein